jgi:hypothetical protein
VSTNLVTTSGNAPVIYTDNRICDACGKVVDHELSPEIRFKSRTPAERLPDGVLRIATHTTMVYHYCSKACLFRGMEKWVDQDTRQPRRLLDKLKAWLA